MDKIIAHCGSMCSNCDAYIVTQANGRAALERTAARWREECNASGITVDSVICDGGMATDGRLSGYCSICEIRPCASGRGVETCAHCTDYDACGKIQVFSLRFHRRARRSTQFVPRSSQSVNEGNWKITALLECACSSDRSGFNSIDAALSDLEKGQELWLPTDPRAKPK